MTELERDLDLELSFQEPILDFAERHGMHSRVETTDTSEHVHHSLGARAVVEAGEKPLVDKLVLDEQVLNEFARAQGFTNMQKGLVRSMLMTMPHGEFFAMGEVDVPGVRDQNTHHIRRFRSKVAAKLNDSGLLIHNGVNRGGSRHKIDPEMVVELGLFGDTYDPAQLHVSPDSDEPATQSKDEQIMHHPSISHTMGSTATNEMVEIVPCEVDQLEIDIVEIPFGSASDIDNIDELGDEDDDEMYDSDHELLDDELDDDDSEGYRSIDRLRSQGTVRVAGQLKGRKQPSSRRADGYVGFPDPELRAETTGSIQLWGVGGWLEQPQQSDRETNSSSAKEASLAIHRKHGFDTKKVWFNKISEPSDEELGEIEEEFNFKAYGNCLGVDTELFFPERGASTKEAKAVCQGCVVREECLEAAINGGEKFGIWGGLSERERRRIRRQRATARAARQTRTA